VPEIQNLLSKINIFALMEINMQIIKAKKEEAKGGIGTRFIG